MGTLKEPHTIPPSLLNTRTIKKVHVVPTEAGGNPNKIQTEENEEENRTTPEYQNKIEEDKTKNQEIQEENMKEGRKIEISLEDKKEEENTTWEDSTASQEAAETETATNQGYLTTCYQKQNSHQE